MKQWFDALRGKFIVFDGPDGSGKSTQFSRFAQAVVTRGLELCEVREPGGTAIGEQIRLVLLDPAHDPMDLRCEMLLYMASRAQLVSERIEPALDRNCLVMADRFVSSTLAYQGTAGGISADQIKQVGRIALGSCQPDLVVIFDVDETAAIGRLKSTLDRMEQKGADYHRRVRRGFLQQVENDPDRHLVIDARADEDAVYEELVAGLQRKFA